MRTVRMPVREFVESFYLSGDLIAASAAPLRAVEGMRVHKSIQSDRGEAYQAEVPVSFSIAGRHVELQLFGRMDGLLLAEGAVTIEEIKSVRHLPQTPGFDGAEVHWAQAKAYAAIFCDGHGIGAAGIDLIYRDMQTERTTVFHRLFALPELKEWFLDLCSRYLDGADREEERLIEAGRLNRLAGFPFQEIRRGQREMIDAVYDAVAGRQPLYVSAPTGIGKTMGTLYPAVKAMGDGCCRKLFYLTARNPVKAVAEDAVRRLLSCGFALRGVTLTAKEKICPQPGTACNPLFCPRAAGFYDRLFPALDEVPAVGHLGRREVAALADKHELCPHELSLSIAEISDIIICDYNHVFDPRVRIRRFFEKGGEYELLVDEAHNLVDRARDMFSAALVERKIRAYLDATPLRPEGPAQADFIASAEALLEALLGLRAETELEEGREICLESVPEALLAGVRELLGCAEPLLAQGEEPEEAFLDLFFMAKVFADVQEEMDERFRILLGGGAGELELRLRCIDPSAKLREVYKKVNSAVFFSATLTPFDYYSRLTGTGGDAGCLMLPSPYPRENFRAVALSLDTSYAGREKTLGRLVEALTAFTSHRRGNYLVFFPSYQYMNRAHALFCERNAEVYAPVQRAGMDEGQRAQFLQAFDREHPQGMVAFAVMGGIFGEGIDLVGDKVIGVAIVGVGIPQLCLERSLIQQYHDNLFEPGYDYAYTVPGFNRVLQAVGRLIRQGSDRGVALLIDRRFFWQKYRDLIPEWWQPVTAARTISDVDRAASSFWSQWADG